MVKLISPNLNYVLLLGAAMFTLSGLSLRTTNEALQIFICTAVKLCSSIGLDVMIAVAIVKMWRIYYIFSIQTGQKIVCYTLVYLVYMLTLIAETF